MKCKAWNLNLEPIKCDTSPYPPVEFFFINLPNRQFSTLMDNKDVRKVLNSEKVILKMLKKVL